MIHFKLKIINDTKTHLLFVYFHLPLISAFFPTVN